MRYNLWSESIVIGVLMLFIGTSILPVTSSYIIKRNSPKDITETNLKVDNPSVLFKQLQLIPLSTYINGTGKTSRDLQEMHDKFKFLLLFNFINTEAELNWGFLGLPLWEWFPLIFHLVGPHRFIVIGFFGNIQKIDDEYYIEGHCLSFVCGSIP